MNTVPTSPGDELRRLISEMVGRTGLRLSPCERVLLDCAARDAILTVGLLSLVERVRDVATVRAGGAR